MLKHTAIAEVVIKYLGENQMGFVSLVSPPDEIVEPVLWFAFQNNKLMVSVKNKRPEIL